MSHEVESMFYVGATPWHSLGVKLAECTSLGAAFDAGGHGFSVHKEPLFRANGQQTSTACIVRDDTDAVVGQGMTLEYEPLQTRRGAEIVFQPFLDTGEVALETGGSLRGGARVWMLGTLKGGEIDLGHGDRVGGHLLFAHGHDGELSIRVGLTAVRVVCANTLSMALGAADRAAKDGTWFTIRHSAKAEDRMIDAAKAIASARSMLAAKSEIWGKLTTIEAPATRGRVAAYLAAVLGKAEIAAQKKAADGLSSPKVEIVSALAENGRGSDLKTARGTAWGLYQAVTEYMTHLQGRGDGRAAAERRAERNVMGPGVRELARAEQVAVDLDRIFDPSDLVRLGIIKASDLVAADGSEMGADK